MPDLNSAIRAKLAEFDASMDTTGSLWGAEEMRSALLAVLDLHNGDDEDHLCPAEIVGYSVQRWHTAADPCPTVRTIAERLGISPTT